MKKLVLMFVMALFAIGMVSALRIGVTTNTYNGNLGGVSGADAKCQSEFGANFKALIGAQEQRDMDTDWVLQPDTNYYRMDKITLIGTTGTDSCFMFLLDNSIGTSFMGIWTGLEGYDSNGGNACKSASAVQGVDLDCTKWTVTSGTHYGGYQGDAGSIGSGALGSTNSPCIDLKPLYCVEQPVNCELITDNSYIDTTCCVKNKEYIDPITGKSTHGNYVSCVADAVYTLRKNGEIDKERAGQIVDLASRSSVNMPPTSKQVSNITGMIASVSLIALLTVFSLVVRKR